MAEPLLTTRRIDFPCLYFSSSGSFNAAQRVRFRSLRAGDRAFFVLIMSDARLRIALTPVLSGFIVTIESLFGLESLVTTTAATGKLTPAAE